MYGPGLVSLSRNPVLEMDFRDGVVSGAGELVLSRLRGDRNGILESTEMFDLLECADGGLERACGLGVVRLSGLKLCPIIVSLTLTLEFHRGLPSGL